LQLYQEVQLKQSCPWSVALLTLLVVLSALPFSGLSWNRPAVSAAGPVGQPPPQAKEELWECWGPGLLDPCRNRLHFVTMSSATDGWALALGLLLRWDGTVWQPVETPPKYAASIAMSSATDGWAVGAEGAIMHWDGNTWNATTQAPTFMLNFVTMRSATDGWAVGEDGFIMHWDGNTWSALDSPTQQGLFSVDMVSDTDGWAVGKHGLLMRYWVHYFPTPVPPLATEPDTQSGTANWLNWLYGIIPLTLLLIAGAIGFVLRRRKRQH